MTAAQVLIAAGLSGLVVVLTVVDRRRSGRVQPGVPAEQPDRRSW